VTIVLDEHANHAAIDRLREGLMASEAVQWAYEISGASDIIALIDCPDMASFNQIAERIIVADPAVRRYETSFVKRDVKFAPFIRLGGDRD
jgi:DNA-binding Lrp family transcriptional regulator